MPEFYLQRWNRPTGLRLWDRGAAEPGRRMSPSKFTVADDFYVTRENGIRDWWLESWFSREMELPASSVLRELGDGDSKIDAERMFSLARFLTAQAYRTEPALRWLHSTGWAESATNGAPVITSNLGPMEAGRAVKRHGITTGHAVRVRNIDFGEAYRSSVYRVHNSRWHLCRFPTPLLLTSDDPVVISYQGEAPVEPVTDFLGAEFWYLPLSPTLAAVMFPDQDPRRVVHGPVRNASSVAEALNLLTIANRGATTFACPRDFNEARYRNFISGECPTPRVNLRY